MSLPSDVSAELLRAIAEYTYDWETWVDRAGVTRWINEAVQRITGHPVQDCLRAADYPLFLALPADRALLANVLGDAARGGSGNDVEFRIVHRDGSVRWVAISWQTVRSADGASLGYRTSVRDIDQRKRAEFELDEIRKRAEALAKARTELLANVSHELRSPAHYIAGFAELLLQAELADPQRRYVELIADQCQSMLRQVEDLLSLSALEAGGVELQHAPVDLLALADGLIEGSEHEARQRGLRLILQRDLRHRWLLGDGLRIRQILRNLIDNAIKFTERGGVELSLREQGEGAQRTLSLEVSDTGQGMAEAQIDTLLLPFRQGDASSSRRHGGVGLGLAIVQRLVRAMDGTLHISSRPGAGTRVTVRLPFVPASAPQHSEPGEFRLHSGHALVVDDSPTARELLGEMLRLCGFSSVEVGSAAAAREAVAREPFDVIFLDYQMPDGDGGQAALSLREVLADKPGVQTRIFILTANVFADQQLGTARAAVDGVLAKPLSRSGLRDVLAGGSPRAHERSEPSSDARTPLFAIRAAHPLLDESLVAELSETRARNGQTLLQKLLPQVRLDMTELLRVARVSLEAGELAELRRHSHAIAGQAAVVGAVRARELARGLEDALADLELDDVAQIEGWLLAIQQVSDEALAVLSERG